MVNKSDCGAVIYPNTHIEIEPTPMPTPKPDPAQRDEWIRRGLRFSQLRLMVALAETGQISAAAAQLAITQPAASRLLAELERVVAAKLFERHPRGVVLTDAGQVLAARARQLLRQLDETHREIDQMTSGTRGLVRIGTVTGPGLELVLPVIRELRVTYPEIELAVQVDTSDKLADALLSRDLDFYLGRVPDGVDSRALTLRPIGPEPCSFIARIGHPLAAKSRIALADCLAYDWVMQAPGGLLRQSTERYLLEKGLDLPARVLSTSSLLLTLALISETNAVAVVSKSVADFYSGPTGPTGRIHTLDVDQDIAVSPFALIRRRGENPGPAAARVLGLVESKIA